MISTMTDVRKRILETRLAVLAQCAAAASKIAGRDVDLVQWAESRTAKWPDPAQRARALARAAEEVRQHGMDEQAIRLLLSAMLNARLAGRAVLLDVFATGATIIATIDRGNTLLLLYQEFLAVDQWMTGPATDDAGNSPRPSALSS
jgi:hypothetical protein